MFVQPVDTFFITHYLMILFAKKGRLWLPLHRNLYIRDLSQGLWCRVALCGSGSVTSVLIPFPCKLMESFLWYEKNLVLWPASKQWQLFHLKRIRPATSNWGMVALKHFAVMLWGLINWKELMERNLNGSRDVSEYYDCVEESFSAILS